jgi:hypothetical protein
MSIRHHDHVFITPSGVQKELLKPADLFVMDFNTREYVRKPKVCDFCSIIVYLIQWETIWTLLGSQALTMYPALPCRLREARRGLLHPHSLPMGRINHPSRRTRLWQHCMLRDQRD